MYVCMYSQINCYSNCSLLHPSSPSFKPLRILNINRPVSNYQNSYLALRLRGIKQKKWIINRWISKWFLLFYTPQPRSQVWIWIIRNWPIADFIPRSDLAPPDLRTFKKSGFEMASKTEGEAEIIACSLSDVMSQPFSENGYFSTAKKSCFTAVKNFDLKKIGQKKDVIERFPPLGRSPE